MPKVYGQRCPVAKTLEVVGDRWTLLVVRDLLGRTRRFQDLQASLPGIAPNILSDRLKLMEEHALVTRRFYSDHPPRAEYELTDKGKELGVVVDDVAIASSRHTVLLHGRDRPPERIGAVVRFLQKQPWAGAVFGSGKPGGSGVPIEGREGGTF